MRIAKIISRQTITSREMRRGIRSHIRTTLQSERLPSVKRDPLLDLSGAQTAN
jgi:hypothetical protein